MKIESDKKEKKTKTKLLSLHLSIYYVRITVVF